MDDRPWHSLPPEIVMTLQPTLGDVADEMIEAVRTVPAYSRPLEGPFGEGIRAGVEEALSHFLAEVQRGVTETRTASSQVLSAAQSLSTESSRLKREVGKFIDSVRAA